MLREVSLSEDLERVAALAELYTDGEERLTGILASEPYPGRRAYLCAFERHGGPRVWLVLDGEGTPIEDRAAVRDAASIAAVCETAAEVAAGGDLEGLRSRLLSLRLSEQPPGIEEAEAAALELEHTVGVPPRLASQSYLDEVGVATRRLEQALGEYGPSPFAEAMKAAVGAVESLVGEVEAHLKRPLARVEG